MLTCVKNFIEKKVIIINALQVLRTNRTLQSLSLARNVIKNEGALALVNVLSKFSLSDYETKLIFTQEQRRTRLIEYLVRLNGTPKN